MDSITIVDIRLCEVLVQCKKSQFGGVPNIQGAHAVLD